MAAATLAALESALARGALDEWLALLPADTLRARARQAIELDRRLWTEHPASLASCLLARTFGVAGFDDLHRAWARELDERGEPWLRPLRGLSIVEGLLAELRGGDSLNLRELARLSFESDDVLVAVPSRFHPTVQPPEERRRDRLFWAWSRGEARLEPDPRASQPLPRELYPRVEIDGWGPAFLVREPGAPRIALPCPDEGSAYGYFSADRSRLFVYGSHDEYAGGFAMVVNPETLAVERKLETRRPVSGLHECDRDDLFVVKCFSDELVVWEGERSRLLPITARDACLSPSGRYLATGGEGVQIWSLAALSGEPPKPGLPTCFDPSGDRLLSGTRLYEGRSGAPVAEIAPEFTQYLEGGPAQPWFHFGSRHLICIQSGLEAYDARSGEQLPVGERLRFPQWFSVAYDRAGERLAALVGGQCRLYELPSGRILAEFELAGTALALSPDASSVAARAGLAVEVRAVSGGPPMRFSHPRGEASGRGFGEGTLRFSRDGRAIASFIKGDGWRLWSLEDEAETHLEERGAIAGAEGFAPPRPRDWDIKGKDSTLFVHRPSGTRIALPATGPWEVNPSAPEIVASDTMHAELRG